MCVNAAIPCGDADRPWRLSAAIVPDPVRFMMTLDAFAGPWEISTSADGFHVGAALVVQRG